MSIRDWFLDAAVGFAELASCLENVNNHLLELIMVTTEGDNGVKPLADGVIRHRVEPLVDFSSVFGAKIGLHFVLNGLFELINALLPCFLQLEDVGGHRLVLAVVNLHDLSRRNHFLQLRVEVSCDAVREVHCAIQRVAAVPHFLHRRKNGLD